MMLRHLFFSISAVKLAKPSFASRDAPFSSRFSSCRLLLSFWMRYSSPSFFPSFKLFSDDGVEYCSVSRCLHVHAYLLVEFFFLVLVRLCRRSNRIWGEKTAFFFFSHTNIVVHTCAQLPITWLKLSRTFYLSFTQAFFFLRSGTVYTLQSTKGKRKCLFSF